MGTSCLKALPPSSHRLLGDLGANYAYVGLMACITLFVVPQYVRALGANWSSVAICLTIQNVLFLMDAALAPTMLRDVARAQANGGAALMYQRYLRFYAGLAVSAFIVALLVLEMLNRARAASGTPLPPDLLLALRLALLQFLFQFSNNAAIGYWSGQGRQRYANLRLAAFALFKHACALLLVTRWRDAAAYMVPFAIIGAIEFGANFRLLRAGATSSTNIPANANATADGWRDSAGFAFAAVLGIATAQIDRVYLTFTLPAADYGIYYLLSSLMLSFFSLQPPIYRAFLPRIATAAEPRALALAMLKLHLVLIVLPSLLLATMPQTALDLWLHNRQIASAGAPTFRWLMIGVAMNALYAPAAMLLVNAHRYRAIASINGAILVLQAIVLFTLTPRLGMRAGACAWLACSGVQLFCGVWIWRSRFGARAPRSTSTADC